MTGFSITINGTATNSAMITAQTIVSAGSFKSGGVASGPQGRAAREDPARSAMISYISDSRHLETAGMPAVKQFSEEQPFSGSLSDYSKLEPNSEFKNTLSFVNDGAAQDVHLSVTAIVEPVEVYVSMDVDAKRIRIAAEPHWPITFTSRSLPQFVMFSRY